MLCKIILRETLKRKREINSAHTYIISGEIVMTPERQLTERLRGKVDLLIFRNLSWQSNGTRNRVI